MQLYHKNPDSVKIFLRIFGNPVNKHPALGVHLGDSPTSGQGLGLKAAGTLAQVNIVQAGFFHQAPEIFVAAGDTSSLLCPAPIQFDILR